MNPNEIVGKKFTIKGRLPSLNEYINDNRTNRYKGAKTKKDAEKLILTAIKRAKLSRVYKYPIELKITWNEPNSRRDVDNVVFATKFIQDAMVKAEIIKDDSQKYINKLSHEVLVDRENPHIDVEIIERSNNDTLWPNIKPLKRI